MCMFPLPGVDIYTMFTQINCWIRGDDTAFGDLFNYYRPRIYRYALRYIKDETRSEDIAMEVLVKIWRSREKITAPETFENYLFTIARNHIISEWRKTLSALLTLDAAETESAPAHDPLAYRELKKAYQAGLSALPEQRRRIFLMHREEHLSYRQIAEQLDISPKTVENQIGATLKHLRSKLSGHLNSFIF